MEQAQGKGQVPRGFLGCSRAGGLVSEGVQGRDRHGHEGQPSLSRWWAGWNGPRTQRTPQSQPQSLWMTNSHSIPLRFGSRGSPSPSRPAGSALSTPSSLDPGLPSAQPMPDARATSLHTPQLLHLSSPPLSLPSALWARCPLSAAPFSLPLARLVGPPLLRPCLSLGSEPCLARV